MLKKSILAALLAAMALVGLAACGTGSGAPTQTDPLTIMPSSATLVVGQSQIFEVYGGHEPITAQVIGCLGEASSCILFNLADGRIGDVRAPLVLERLGAHLIRVTFMDATLKPVSTRLHVFDTSPDASKFGDEMYAMLNLVY